MRSAIELAKEAGLALTDHGHPEGYAVFCERLERFAALVRAERDWVDLTDDELWKMADKLNRHLPAFHNEFARAVIAAFKEKNK